VKINAPITLNDRERQLVRKLTDRIPRIRVEMPKREAPTKQAEEPKNNVLDRLLRRKRSYPVS